MTTEPGALAGVSTNGDEPVDHLGTGDRAARRLVAAIPRVHRQSRALEIRTVAGPSRALQWALSGGPYGAKGWHW